MWEFLRKLRFNKQRELTIIVMDDDKPDDPDTFRFRPQGMFYWWGGVFVFSLVIVITLLGLTPLGSYIFGYEDEELRRSVIEVTQKLNALEDSLIMRDQQLSNIKQVMIDRQDTTFSVNNELITETEYQQTDRENTEFPLPAINPADMEEVIGNQMLFTRFLQQSPDFPASYPMEGTVTRGFQADAGHFGLDIAGSEGDFVKAVADGAVINSEWTVNYGYVMHIQHSDGVVSVYKHCANLLKIEGDLILKGEILGSIGYSGVMSSGPHIHIELWKDGVPLDPANYLVKR
ncbi:MAG: murein hydrolase activator EnvC family protein [Bacteroidota bacterium]